MAGTFAATDAFALLGTPGKGCNIMDHHGQVLQLLSSTSGTHTILNRFGSNPTNSDFNAIFLHMPEDCFPDMMCFTVLQGLLVLRLLDLLGLHRDRRDDRDRLRDRHDLVTCHGHRQQC